MGKRVASINNLNMNTATIPIFHRAVENDSLIAV